jgi:hypothetical protein
MPSGSYSTSRSVIRGVAGSLLALAMSATLASAQASRVGPTFLVNQYANGSVTQAKETDVAYDSVHSVYLEVWGFGNIYGRFVGADGTVLGAGPFVIQTTTAYAEAPRVAFSPDAGVFMVIWQDNRINPNIPHIFGRLVSYQPSGAPLFPNVDFQVSQNVTHPRSNIAIAYSTGSHVFMAVYQVGDMYGHRFDVTGTAVGPEFKLSTDGSWYEQPDVTYNPTADEFFVTWAHWIDAWNAGLIQGRRVKAGTEELLTLVNVDSLSRSTYGPTSVAYDPVRNQYLVAFYRIVTAFTTYGRLIAADGTPVGPQFTVASTGTYVTNGVAYNPVSDTYFVVFPHHDIPEIYGAQVSGAGVPDPMMRVTTVLDSNPAVIGVDYPRVAAATDRPEWLASSNIWWTGAIGQRVRTNTVGTPGIFSKTSPSNGAAGQARTATLSWTPVAGGSFEVCVDTTNNNTCDTAWQPVGLPTTTTTSNLPDGTYYWQVRNVAAANTEANTGTWWSFSVGVQAFSKVAPANGTGGLSSPVALTWTAFPGATSYQVCVDSVNNGSCDTSWVAVGNTTSYAAPRAVGTYYWQVRAYNGAYTVADGGTEWGFTVTVGTTSAYTKLTPVNGTTGVTNPVTFAWTAMAGAASYDVCVDQNNDNSCNTSWVSVGGATSYQLSGLANGTYYWQVRAQTSRTMADSDAWGSFTVGGTAPPAGFGKTAPANGATGVSATPTLSWGSVTGASFQLCVDTTNNNACDASWQTLGPATSATLTTLPAGNYYWQVKATTGSGTIDADTGTWWSFSVGGTTQPPSGSLFSKTAPTNAAGNQGASVAVSWGAVANATYQVCLSTTGPACDTAWFPTAVSPTRTFDGLTAGVYYWQARATVGGTTTEADNGIWWTFVVGTGSAANRFGKLSPMTGTTTATGSPVTMSWSPVTGATYEVCVDAVANTTCDTTWQSAGTATSLVRSDLTTGLYYWQVRAIVSGTPTEANGGAWWAVTVPAPPLPLFSKLTPANGTSGLSSSAALTWGSVSNASYQVCLDTTNNNTCDTTWWPTAVSTTRTFEGLAPGTYYWQVRSTVGATTTEADNGTWWSFTVGSPDPGIIDMSPVTAPNGSWVFAEGALGQTAGFTTYYAIANENAGPVHVRGWLVNEDTGRVIFFDLPNSIPASTRQTVALSAIVGPTAPGRYSAVFQSVPYAADNIPAGRQIYVARSSYWGGASGIQSGPGHEKTGTFVAAGTSLPTAWYFPEGTRVWSPVGQFETYYTVFNPNQTAANVVVEFLGDKGEGVIRTVTYTLAAQTRWTLSASAYADLNARNFSVRLTSSNGVGVVAERPMYWGAAWEGGHAGAGGTTTSLDWYFAEGTAQSGFDTYYTLLNPTTQSVTVDATYQLSPRNGVPQSPVSRSYALPPASRMTVYLYNEVGYQPGVAAEFHASSPIVAERSMYWSSPWTDGSTVSGAAAAAVEWHLPEGSTINGYETFLCLSNPNTSAASVDVTTFSSTGAAETKTVTVGAKSRLTVWMNNTTPADGPVFSSIQNATFSLRVVSTGTTPLPIVAEEAVYWNRLAGAGQYWRGGDAVLGWPVIR